MNLRFDGKNALVTGGSRGIGRATVLALARSGAAVVTCYRHDEVAAGTLADELARIGVPHRVIRADVTDPAGVTRLVAECKDAFGRLDVLVNNAGVDATALFEAMPDDEWERVVGTNLTSVGRVTRGALPLLRRRATVVNIGAAAAARGVPGRTHYGAAKAGVAGLTRALARELGPRGIRVNTVAPGIVETGRPADQHSAMRAAIASRTSLRRLGTPEEIADVVLFLASDLNGYVTGTTVTVDGGL